MPKALSNLNPFYFSVFNFKSFFPSVILIRHRFAAPPFLPLLSAVSIQKLIRLIFEFSIVSLCSAFSFPFIFSPPPPPPPPAILSIARDKLKRAIEAAS